MECGLRLSLRSGANRDWATTVCASTERAPPKSTRRACTQSTLSGLVWSAPNGEERQQQNKKHTQSLYKYIYIWEKTGEEGSRRETVDWASVTACCYSSPSTNRSWRHWSRRASASSGLSFQLVPTVFFSLSFFWHRRASSEATSTTASISLSLSSSSSSSFPFLILLPTFTRKEEEEGSLLPSFFFSPSSQLSNSLLDILAPLRRPSLFSFAPSDGTVSEALVLDLSTSYGWRIQNNKPRRRKKEAIREGKKKKKKKQSIHQISWCWPSCNQKGKRRRKSWSSSQTPPSFSSRVLCPLNTSSNQLDAHTPRLSVY